MDAHDAHVSAERPSARSEAETFIVVSLIDRLSGVAGALSALALLAMAGIICFDVFSRYLFNEPTYWAPDVATYILVGMTFMALAAGQRSGSHIRVELLLGALGPAMRERVELVAIWLGLFVVVFGAWQMIAFNYQEYVNDSRDWGLLATPQWIPELPVSVGYVTFILAILADIYRLRPPAGALARWSAPAVAVVLAIVLYALGPFLVMIDGTRLDWGSVSILVGFAVAMTAWSGIRIAVPALAIILLAAVVFWSARGLSLVPVTILLILVLMLLLLLGVRIALALGLAGMYGLYFLLPQPQLSVLAERSWSSVNTFALTAVPMFVLMGGLLFRSGVSTEMFDALMRWFGRVPGGIAYASVGASTIFAAVSSSSIATAATLGTVACPEMVRRGYSTRLTYGVVAAGATLGILIPPSIAMIIYGVTVGAPVTVLFVAGIVPGLLLTLAFMTGVFVWSKLVPGAAPAGEPYTVAEKVRSLLGTLPFVVLIVAVLGSLYAGIATPTEAGAIGAAVAFLLCVLRRRLTPSTLYATALETVRVTAFLLLIVIGASILSWVFDYLRLPRTMVEVVEAAELAPWMVMTAIGLIYIVLGMFIDPISMMLMTLPVAFPLVTSLGFDAIWFGIALVLMIEVALITPPVGIVLFVLRGISQDVPLAEIVYGVLPFVFILLGFVVLLYFFPEIVAWLPSRME
ncbi:MAG: TRAP transporter large permease subunit [Geminicoccaceae bacterium]